MPPEERDPKAGAETLGSHQREMPAPPLFVPVAFAEDEAIQVLAAARSVFQTASIMGEAEKVAPLARGMVALATAIDKARAKHDA